MGKYLKQFDTHQQYEAYTAYTETFIKPNVSYCIDTPNEVHYNPLECEETSVYEVIGTPSYPSEVDGADTSFEMTVNYKRTDTDSACTEAVTEGTDTVVVEIGTNPSTSGSRTVSGTVTWNGNEIEYNVTQSKYVAKIITKYNVTDTSNPTKIGYNKYTSGFSTIEIDGVVQPSVVSAYTFSTTGEHTVKYTLTDPTSIGNYAFNNCISLTSIDIPNNVTTIGSFAFAGCTSLTSIDIPNNVTSIDNSAFHGCSSLTSIDIPSGVTSISNQTFYDCGGLTSVTIPDSVTSIGSGAFNFCISLTSVTIPDSVTSIGSGAFAGCTSLTSCTIGSGVTSIGNGAFSSCSGLTSCTIGSGVTSIGERAFYKCTSLTSIVCNATTAPTIQSITFEYIKTGGTLIVPIGSSGYDVWMGTSNHYLGYYNWTKVEQ